MPDERWIVKLTWRENVGWFRPGKVQDSGPFSWSILAEAAKMSRQDADKVADMMRLLYGYEVEVEEALV